MSDDGRVKPSASDLVGPIPEVGSFQRRRVRRTAIAIAAIAVVSVALVLASVMTAGVAVTFGAGTHVQLPIAGLLAASLLSPIVWSAVFRSRRYGLTITEDALVVESWWRRRTFDRASISAAEPLPGMMRLRDGFFSGRGSAEEPFTIWLRPSQPDKDELPLGVTTGTWDVTSAAAMKINAWLGAEIDCDEDRAHRLLDEN